MCFFPASCYGPCGRSWYLASTRATFNPNLVDVVEQVVNKGAGTVQAAGCLAAEEVIIALLDGLDRVLSHY